ncbi:16755_t:CDS:2, partial [Dentiscutata erythropus]
SAHCHSPIGGQVDVNKILDSYEQKRYSISKNVVSDTGFITKIL